MFVACCATFVISFLVMAIQVGDKSKEPVTPGVIIFFPPYFLLLSFLVYLPLGACAGLAWSRVLDGASRLAVVRRDAVLGLIVAAVVGVPLAYGWLTRPIPVGHPGEPPRTRPPVSELLIVELSLFALIVGGYSAWAWLAGWLAGFASPLRASIAEKGSALAGGLIGAGVPQPGSPRAGFGSRAVRPFG